LLFHSLDFAILLAAVWPAYLLLARWKRQNLLLLAASYVFYGWWDYRFLPLLWASTLTDFFVAREIEANSEPRTRRALLVLSCVVNLGLLGFFKYWGFFESTANGIGHWLGIESAILPALHVVLPVGISFYTFQTLGYSIDVYRGHVRASRSLSDFALYVGFFPQLVAGPIERAANLLPRLMSPRRVAASDLEAGVFLFASGWLRKSLGDVMGGIADPVFADPGSMTASVLLWGLYAFAFQIYLDFSGYTDMARGVARLLGIELMENFNAPYFSRNVREFWQRWHISLSTWLRDYLYIPLGGNRGGTWRIQRNLMVTMLLGGLWHGAAWNFVVWGALHGSYLAIHRRMSPRGDRAAPEPVREASSRLSAWARDGLRMGFTFHLVLLGWLLFRVRPVGERDVLTVALDYLTGLAGLWGGTWSAPPVAFWTLLLVLAFDAMIIRSGTHLWTRTWPWPVRGTVSGLVIGAALVFGSPRFETFIYFQF
jgi:alginate O-acetyltransferase complex protein AlgI